jgi:hypothetical protein
VHKALSRGTICQAACILAEITIRKSQALLEEYPTPDSFEHITTRRLTNLIQKLSKGRFKKENRQKLNKKLFALLVLILLYPASNWNYLSC